MRLADDPPSNSGVGRVQHVIGEVRRLWVLAAAAKISFERGPDSVSLSYVAERSGIPHSEVLALFPETADLLRATFSKATAVAAEYLIPRFAAEPDPLERSRLATAHLLAFCEAEPELACVCVVDCAATERPRADLSRTLSRIVSDWFDGYSPAPAGRREPLLTQPFELAMGLIADALRGHDTSTLAGHYPKILEAVLTPAIGVTAARAVASRPAPEAVPPYSLVGPHGERLVLDLRLTAGLLDELNGLYE